MYSRQALRILEGLIIFLLLAVTLFCVSGCAGWSQTIAIAEKSDKIAVQAANDNIVTGIEDALCALPYGALLRHPELQPAAKSVCGSTSIPSTLLPSPSATP